MDEHTRQEGSRNLFRTLPCPNAAVFLANYDQQMHPHGMLKQCRWIPKTATPYLGAKTVYDAFFILP